MRGINRVYGIGDRQSHYHIEHRSSVRKSIQDDDGDFPFMDEDHARREIKMASSER